MADYKRERPSWEESFMFHAIAAAARSSCRKLHTGAVIVKDKRIIASGYNGAPPGIENCLVRGCRKEACGIDFNDKGRSACRGSHAELNAMSQIARADLKDSTLYTVYYPCTPCAKVIAGNGIAEVVYSKIYEEPESLTQELFEEEGIKIRKLEIDIERYFENIRQIIQPK